MPSSAPVSPAQFRRNEDCESSSRGLRLSRAPSLTLQLPIDGSSRHCRSSAGTSATSTPDWKIASVSNGLPFLFIFLLFYSHSWHFRFFWNSCQGMCILSTPKQALQTWNSLHQCKPSTAQVKAVKRSVMPDSFHSASKFRL